VIAAMAVVFAGSAFLLDVGDLAAGGDFAVVPGDAPARQRRVPEEPNETHHATLLPDLEQFLYRRMHARFSVPNRQNSIEMSINSRSFI
jgi:hypothetical protein